MSEGYTQAEYDQKLEEAKSLLGIGTTFNYTTNRELDERIRYAARESRDDEQRPKIVKRALLQYLKHGRAW